MKHPPLRRIVTGHDTAGRAVVCDDALLDPLPNSTGDAAFTLVWTTATLPVDHDDPADGRDREVGLTLPGGTVLRIVDLLPGRRSAMHRTDSLDHGIVLSGTIELELDDGAVSRVEAGAVIVQRGTVHAWRNPSADTPVRVAFVLIDAAPATAGGTPLRRFFQVRCARRAEPGPARRAMHEFSLTPAVGAPARVMGDAPRPARR